MAAAPGSKNFRSRVPAPVSDSPTSAPPAVECSRSDQLEPAVEFGRGTEEIAANYSPGGNDAGALAANASSHKSTVAHDSPEQECPSLSSAASPSHISAEEIIMLVELLSRDTVQKTVKTALLHKAIDQKIEGALKAERQRSSIEREQQDGDIARLKKRMKELLEKCDAERAKVSAALMQAEEERRARTMAETEAHRASASEVSKLAHLQSLLDDARHREDTAKDQLREYEERAAKSQKELHEAKERLSGATVSQRLLRAYKAEKQRCQVDLEQTLRTFSDPAWQEEQQIEELEKSAISCQAVLESVQGVMPGTRKRHVQASTGCGQQAGVTLPLKSQSQGAGESHSNLKRTFHRPASAPSDGSLHGAVSPLARTSQGLGGKGGTGGAASAEPARSSDGAFPDEFGVPESVESTVNVSSACAHNRSGEKEAELKQPKDTPSGHPPPLPPIPMRKKPKVEKQDVIHIT